MKFKYHLFAPAFGVLILGILCLKPESPVSHTPSIGGQEEVHEDPEFPEEEFFEWEEEKEFVQESEQEVLESLSGRIEEAFADNDDEGTLILAQMAASYGSFDNGIRALGYLLRESDLMREDIDQEVQYDVDMMDMLAYAVGNSTSDRDVRVYAAETLGGVLDLQEVIDLFGDRLEREGDPRVHTAMVNSLLAVKHSATIPVLEKAFLNAPDQASRERVCEVLEEASATDVLARLSP